MNEWWALVRESMLNPAEQTAKAYAVRDFLTAPGRNHWNAYCTFKAEHRGWTAGGGLTVDHGRYYVNMP